MTDPKEFREQEIILYEKIETAINYMAKEYEMSIMQVVGVLEDIKFRWLRSAQEDEEL